MFANFSNDRVRVGEGASLFLRVEIVSGQSYFKDAARTWHQTNAGELILVIVRYLFRQTGGFFQVASSSAVFDLEFHLSPRFFSMTALWAINSVLSASTYCSIVLLSEADSPADRVIVARVLPGR